MGMAASQARFLGLTARKSNVEYEGQQINQQRTSLSNQSATYYNQMLSLQVPIPPSTEQFSKVEYVFQVPNSSNQATINQTTQITSGADAGKYTVVFTYESEDTGFNACSFNDRYAITKTGTGTAADPFKYTAGTKLGTKELTLYDPADPTQKALHKDAYDKLITGGDSMYIVNVGTASTPKYQYFKKSDLDKSQAPDADKKSIYYESGTVKQYHTDSYTPCDIIRDPNGRIMSISYQNTNIAVKTNTVTDSQSYEDAYNQYTYETYLYNKSIEDINSKTQLIQSQDKQLELRLKQIDTEHTAIQTEMEAVSSVIKKNAEDTFKTFA